MSVPYDDRDGVLWGLAMYLCSVVVFFGECVCVFRCFCILINGIGEEMIRDEKVTHTPTR